MTEHASEIRGYEIVTEKEGARLGNVSHVFLDPEAKKVSGVTFRPNMLGHESWVDATDITLIGRDVILIKTEEKARSLTGDAPWVHGRSLKELQGIPVVTHAGKQLGKLKDLEVQGEQWTISELMLSDAQRVPVEQPDLVIGPDQVVLPENYADRVTSESSSEPRFLRRVFSAETAQEISESVKRTLKRGNGDAKEEKEHSEESVK
jgi:sporulation protein YlmC with PRC-barrel domain